MKKLLSLTALLSVLGAAALMTGCGDDEEAAIIAALANIQGQEITLTPAGGQPQKYSFSTQGNNFTLFDNAGNVVATGTYTYDPVSNTARLTVTPAGAAASQVINLVFTGLNAGVYSGTYATTDPNGAPISGSFQAQAAAVIPPPPPPAEVCGDGIDNNGNGQIDENCPVLTEVCGDGIDNNANGQIDENCPPPGGAAPASIANKRLQLQTTPSASTPGGQELLTLTSGSTFLSDLQAGVNGSYTYTPSGNTAVFSAQYQAPAEFARDHYELTLSFATATSGTFSGNQHFGDADHQTTGTFSLTD